MIPLLLEEERLGNCKIKSHELDGLIDKNQLLVQNNNK